MAIHFLFSEATTFCLLFASLFVSYTFFLGIYNHYFHPLAKFPGPVLAGLTDWYLVYVICSVPTFGLELHTKYGPIVRLAPNMLSFSDPTLLPHVYHRCADKPAFYGSWMFGHTAAMFQSLKHQDHYAKKRLVAPCCSMAAMKMHHETKISRRIDELCIKIKERSSSTGKPIDFSQYIRFFLGDVWSHLVYGKPKGFVAQGQDVNGFLESLQGIYSMSATAAVNPWLIPLLRHPFLRKYFWSWTKTFRDMEKLFSDFDTRVNHRLENGRLQEQTLFFDGIDIAKSSQELCFSREDLKAEIITFTAATLDGVAAFISPFIDNLLMHPKHYARLVDEIQAADNAGRLCSPVVSYEDTTRLPFFMACIKETLRCDAPAQTILPRLVSHPGYKLFDGTVYVPPGTQMGASPYIIHRDPAIFGDEPGSWKPTRWIQEESGMDPKAHELYVKKMEKFGMWWGYGDRECVGKYYAQMEMQKLCIELIRRFDIKSTNPTKRFTHARWAVGMFWNQQLEFNERK